MQSKVALTIMAALLMWAAPLKADIYHWVDTEGVTHYANTNPPADAAQVSRSNEISYNAAADQERKAADAASLKAFLERESRDERARMELEAQRLAAETARRERAAAEALLRSASEAQPVYEYTGIYRRHGYYHRPRPCIYGTENGCKGSRPYFHTESVRNPQDHFFLSTPAHLKPLFSRRSRVFRQHLNHGGNFGRSSRHLRHGANRTGGPLHRHGHGSRQGRFHR